ncbi:MAG: sigma-54-dependent Fis family transcriptional regulator, partial [Elusimicrobiales bacterium]|nr:sigma-54-dependent Fis family transcriptional regulator [Elusimicrobiales bacterium]
MNKLKIFVVEDDKLAQKLMSKHLSEHVVDFADNKLAAIKKLKTNNYDICFFDLMLGIKDDYSGLKLIPLAIDKGIYTVIMSSSDSDEIVDKAYELGANDFYAKGNEESNVDSILKKFISNKNQDSTENIFTNRFITKDKSVKSAIMEALKYASSQLPILILGPSGTGKTSLAKIIHEHSGFEGNFVAINCSAYSEDLLEAELFGYKKGAFTGADKNRKGRLLEADKGTLFLDEIGNMSLNMQMKLLKSIEEKTFYPLGSDKAEHSDFRIISATLENPKQLIAQGKLRFDLFQRVHGFTINLKPLNQKKDDIFPLIQHFVHGGKRLAFMPDAKDYITNHPWPGNIRELKKFTELMAESGEGRINLKTVARHLSAVEKITPPENIMNDSHYKNALANGLEETLNLLAYEIIQKSLKENKGKKTKTLSELKISTRFLYSILR